MKTPPPALIDPDADWEARRYAESVAVGILADDFVEARRQQLGLPKSALEPSPLMAIGLAESPEGTKQ